MRDNNILRAADRRELIDGHGCQFAVGKLQEDFVAEDFVVRVALDVHSVPAALGTDYGPARLGDPTFLSHGDNVLHFDAIFHLQFIDMGNNLAIAGSHSTTPDGPDGYVGVAVKLPPQLRIRHSMVLVVGNPPAIAIIVPSGRFFARAA